MYIVFQFPHIANIQLETSTISDVLYVYCEEIISLAMNDFMKGYFLEWSCLVFEYCFVQESLFYRSKKKSHGPLAILISYFFL